MLDHSSLKEAYRFMCTEINYWCCRQNKDQNRQVTGSNIFQYINYWHDVLSLAVSDKLQPEQISFRLGVFANAPLNDWKGCNGVGNSICRFLSTQEFSKYFPLWHLP